MNRLDAVVGGRLPVRFVSKMTSLHKLNLSRQSIGPAVARALAKVLKVNTALKEIHRNDNSIGDGGATDLAAVLRVNMTLMNIDLADNAIDDAGALADVRKVNKTLRKIRLM